MNEDMMLTTSDNPFDPHTDYESWLDWDQSHGYYTNEYIARLMNDKIDYDVDAKALDQLYEEIIRLNITGNYVLV